jgi:hypothetical protein
MVNITKEESSFKDKIKVYIKEPNMPEYIQLWDTYNDVDVKYWLLNKGFCYKTVLTDYCRNYYRGVCLKHEDSKEEIYYDFKI